MTQLLCGTPPFKTLFDHWCVTRKHMYVRSNYFSMISILRKFEPFLIRKPPISVLHIDKTNI